MPSDPLPLTTKSQLEMTEKRSLTDLRKKAFENN